MQAVKDMVADLSALIDAHNRGEDTDERFREFMDKHGQFFPDDPQSIEELIDSLARRAAAQERMMAGLSPEQRAELADLMAQTMSDMGLASEMAHLQDALRQARPDLPWGQRGQVPDGEQGLGLGDATSRRRGARRPRGAVQPAVAGLRRRLAGRHRRGTARARAGPARPSTTWPRCGRWSASSSGRATSTAPTASSSSPRRRSAGWARRRCAGCSPSSTPPAAASTTWPTPEPPVSSPAARGSGSSATSSRSTSSAP